MVQKGSQTIECDVKSCKHNSQSDCMCVLSGIKVAPKKDCHSSKGDESLCASYECRGC
jgi:hypothetical protein